HARAREHGGGEADLVVAVVDAEPEAAPIGEVAAQAVDEGEREVAVRDGRPEGTLALRALDVDVDPLVVAAELSELVDHLLRHLAPLARADELVLERLYLLDPVRDCLGHA